MLHDASGNNGPLRMRLSTSAPRFIVRYQQLQEHVSRLQLEPPSQDMPVRTHAEVQDCMYHCLNLPLRIYLIAVLAQQSVPTSVTENTDHSQSDAFVEVRGYTEKPAETILSETHIPQQISEEESEKEQGDTGTEPKHDHHEEVKDGHAVEGEDSSKAHSIPLSEEHDEGAHGDEEGSSSTLTYPALEDEAHGGDGDVADAAVIGLDVLEAEAGEEQEYDDDKSDITTEHHHDFPEQAEDEYVNDGQDSEQGSEDARDENTAERVVLVEETVNDNREEQGDDVFYEHSDAEGEAETDFGMCYPLSYVSLSHIP